MLSHRIHFSEDLWVPTSAGLFLCAFLIGPLGLGSEPVNQSGISQNICFYALQGTALLFVRFKRALKQWIQPDNPINQMFLIQCRDILFSFLSCKASFSIGKFAFAFFLSHLDTCPLPDFISGAIFQPRQFQDMTTLMPDFPVRATFPMNLILHMAIPSHLISKELQCNKNIISNDRSHIYMNLLSSFSRDLSTITR